MSTRRPLPDDLVLASVTAPDAVTGDDEHSPQDIMASPTLSPLPEVCLQEPFAEDVEACGDIPRYEISLTLDLGASQVSGHQRVDYTNLEDQDLSNLYVRLFPNSPNYGGSMTVSDVLLAGQPVTPTFELEDTALRIPLEPPLQVGETTAIALDFTVDVPTTEITGHGLFSYRQGIMALPNVYALIPVYNDEGWNIDQAPTHGDDVFSDVADFNVTVTAPLGLSVIASGTCARAEMRGESATWVCEAAPMRDFAVIAAQDLQHRNRTVAGVVVNSYFYPGHDTGGQKALDVAVNALRVFNDLFGAYPYSELDVVETPNYLGGMEYPGLIVIQDDLYANPSRVEWLTAHEIAHQWWFGLVGSDQIDEPWLDEALTQYSSTLYYEQQYGEAQAESIRESAFRQVHRELIQEGQDLPIGLPAGEYSAPQYWDIVYDKGALYFHTLRQRVGDEAFFSILQTYYQRNKYGIASGESFLNAVEAVTGDTHRDLYAAWVTGQPSQ